LRKKILKRSIKENVDFRDELNRKATPKKVFGFKKGNGMKHDENLRV
jgi:hypothetical protein